MDLDDVPNGGGQNRERYKLSEHINEMKLPPNKWVRLRILPGLSSTATYWVKTKKKDGQQATFGVTCPSYDPATMQRDSTIYDPWAQHSGKKDEGSKPVCDYNMKAYLNVISREAQKKTPKVKHSKDELAAGHLIKDAETQTPVRVLAVGRSVLGQLKELKDLNTRTSSSGETRAFSVNDKKFGRDIMIMYSPNKSPAEMYKVQLADGRAPLTEEEQAYLLWPLDTLMPKPDDEATTRSEYTNWAKRNGIDKLDDEDEDEDEDEPPKKSKKSKKVVDDFDDEDEDDFDEPPKKSKKSKKVVDDFDDEDEDDFDEPPKKSKKSKKVVDDFDDEDEDEDEDEPPKKSKKSKKVVDDFDDEDEDEDEDEPPKKSKKSKKVVDDFDDEDEDEPPKKSKKSKKVVDDFDDEDEDEPPKKSKKSKKVVDDFDDEDEDEDEPPKKSKKSKKVVDDFDDEDEDEPW